MRTNLFLVYWILLSLNITAFSENQLNHEVSESRAVQTQHYAASPSIISLESPSGSIRVGDTVIGEDNAIGRVTALFDNGTAVVKYAWSSAGLQVSTLSPLVNELGKFKVGDTVMDEGNAIGRIVGLFANGKAVVKYTWSSTITTTDKLSRMKP